MRLPDLLSSHSYISSSQKMKGFFIDLIVPQEVNFEYDAEDKHYVALLHYYTIELLHYCTVALLLETIAGEYKIMILKDINGKRGNGHFSFTE